jgi:TonB family protein
VADNLADLNASSAPSETVDSTAEPAMPSSAEVAGDSDGSAAPSTDTDAPVLERVLPDVPASASRTIRGSVRVSVRVIVEQDGTVFAALAENPGPSRYFERLAIEAAKRWTFVPSQGEDQRLMLIRFVFTRDGTAAHATALP